MNGKRIFRKIKKIIKYKKKDKYNNILIENEGLKDEKKKKKKFYK